MPNNYLSVVYKHIIQVENKNVGLKVKNTFPAGFIGAGRRIVTDGGGGSGGGAVSENHGISVPFFCIFLTPQNTDPRSLRTILQNKNTFTLELVPMQVFSSVVWALDWGARVIGSNLFGGPIGFSPIQPVPHYWYKK